MSEETAGSHGKLTAQMTLAFVFGVVFLSVIIYVVVVQPKLDSFGRMVILVVLSLAAGGVGAILPGFIVAGHPSKLVRAGGALAVFLVVLYFGSQYIKSDDGVVPYKPVADPSSVSNNFLSLVEAGKNDEAYSLTSKVFRSAMNSFFFAESSKKILAKLGVPSSRIMVDQKIELNPVGVAPGFYCYTIYVVDYPNFPEKVYLYTTVVGEKDVADWRIFGVFFYTKTASGSFSPINFN